MKHKMDEGGLSTFSDMVSDASILEQDFPSSTIFEKGTEEEEEGKEKLILQEKNDEENINGKDSINSPGNDIEKAMENNNDLLPEDVLSIINNKLDFDDLFFSFGSVCNDWRESFAKFLAQFMASPAPLVIQMSRPPTGNVHFLSLFDGKSYAPKLPMLSANVPRYSMLHYIGFSSGYMIMVKRTTNKFFLVNPFMRTSKMQIPEPVVPPNTKFSMWDHAIVAFAVGSEDEFVIVGISRPQYRLFSYQSRNNSWMCYDDNEFVSHRVVDVVILHHALYVINYVGNIGVVSLNTPRMKFIQFKNAPKVRYYKLKLVVSEGQLLVVQFRPFKKMELKVHRIDFTTMEWVKLESLGDRALFLSRDTKCYALSNPGWWGYEADRIYYIEGKTLCKVYGMDGELICSFSRVAGVIYGDDEGIFARIRRGQPWFVDWCFRNLRDEVDYSLDD